jgi:tetratricopeptide (TPR) repeat protein
LQQLSLRPHAAGNAESGRGAAPGVGSRTTVDRTPSPPSSHPPAHAPANSAAAADPTSATIAAQLGLALLQRGCGAEALASIDRAIALDPGSAEAHNTRGAILLAEQRPAEALAACDAAVALKPDFARAVANRATALLRLHRVEAALDAATQAIALNPELAEAHMKRAIALSHLARYAEALTAVDQALNLAPSYAEASNLRGIVLMAMGRLPEALSGFAHAVALRPDFVDALFNQGTVLTALERRADAVATFDRVLALRPDHAVALVNRGNALVGLGQVEEGLASCNAAVSAASDYAAAHNSRGSALIALNRHVKALAAYDRALALDPQFAEAHYNRANALQRLDRLDDALSGYERALTLLPDFMEARHNHGATLHCLGRHAEALIDFARVQAMRPDFVDAHCYESLSRLALGDFREGWRKYEWRWKSADLLSARRSFPQPLWLGETPLTGRTLLIHAEQGFGDTLQFCRYLPLLPPDVRIIFEVQRPLLRLMQRLPRLATPGAPLTLVAHGDELPPFDLQCPLLSLPLAFGTALETIPHRVPYLGVDPGSVSPWRARVAALPGLRVGICWSGDPRHHLPSANTIDRRRSTELASWAPLAALPTISLVSLQKGASAQQLADPPPGLTIHDWTDELDDFADTAALVETLDLVITVDTATAHLTGALGKPVWILNRYDACWRWLTNRTDSPWYPTATLFRQPNLGNWGAVFAEVAAALRDVTAVPARRALTPWA